MKPKSKRRVTWILLGIAIIVWVLTPVIPFLNLSKGLKVGLTAFAIIAGEGFFIVAMLLQGKIIWRYVRRRWKHWTKTNLRIKGS